MAGESAGESARRQREKAERLLRSADLYERGAEGEQRTASVLDQLPADQWTVFHDLRWPGRRYANVDHVVVGPPGVFVVDSKNWSGSITVDGDVLRQNRRSRETAVAGAAEAALAVGRLAPLLRPDLVYPVLCFVRDEPLTGWARDVMVASTANVATMLQSRPPVLSPDEVRQASLELDAGFRAALVAPPAPRPRRATGPTRATRQGRSPSRRRRKDSMTGDLIRLVLAVGLVAVLVTKPELVTGLATWASQLFVAEVMNQP